MNIYRFDHTESGARAYIHADTKKDAVTKARRTFNDGETWDMQNKTKPESGTLHLKVTEITDGKENHLKDETIAILAVHSGNKGGEDAQ